MTDAMTGPVLHIVHTIDTEGPLDEDLDATFQRIGELFGVWLTPSREMLADLQARRLDLGGQEEAVAKVVAPQLLAYNRNWADVQRMLDEALSQPFRRETVDDFDGGWVYSWHCVDHLGFSENPRHKDFGYGNVFRFYQRALRETGSSRDEINFHFHPLSVTRSPLAAATSYANSMDVLLGVLARRVIEDKWFPTTYRPGFHSERPDAHLFFEQWIPFDYANQAIEEAHTGQKDTLLGRFGDWSRAPRDWLGYHPGHDDYQVPGACRRWIFRCLNVGTRFRLLQERDLVAAFEDAARAGSAIVAFADHDYRDLRPDVRYFRELLARVRPRFPGVRIRFSGAHEAAVAHVARREPHRVMPPLEMAARLEEGRFHVEVKQGAVFGPQPFLAMRNRAGAFFHDNFDVVEPGRRWTYVLDGQTIPLEALSAIGVGAAGASGHFCVKTITLP